MTAFAALAGTSRRVAESPGRNAKIAALAACLRALGPAEIHVAVAYLSGETPQGRSGVGHALVQSAMPAGDAYGSPLAIADVDAAIGSIAQTSGAGSKAARTKALAALLARANAEERDFLVRLLLGELRQGALASLMIEAVAAAAELPVGDVREAAMVANGIAEVAQAALTEGAAGLRRYAMVLMQPVAPMLAQPAQDIGEALAAFGTAAFEWKLDGARVQVHKSGDDVRIFTRNRNDVTASAPEIVAAMRDVQVRELIVDGEAIALSQGGAPQPFQVTMRRFGRKLDVARLRTELPLAAWFFDCLYRDGTPLVDRPAHERFDALDASVPAALVIPRLVTADVAAAADFYADALARGHEGVMVKALDARYEAGSRGASWLKVKRAHTLDLVVLAAEWGHGRRHGRLSNLHLGARDPAGGWVMLGKTFKGMTDELLAWQTRELLARETRRDASTVYVRPELVVEVAFNDLQASPQYAGGLALRFARVKGYRPDKRARDADTIGTVRALYDAQAAGGAR